MKKRLPSLLSIAQFVFLYFTDKNTLDSVMEDLESRYHENSERRGTFIAGVICFLIIFLISGSFLIDKTVWGLILFRNHLKITGRNLRKNKGFAVINIAGLTIGLSLFFLIIVYMRFELNYDRYHKNAGRIYRVLRELKDDSIWMNTSEHPLAAAMKTDFPEISHATRVKKNDEIGIVAYKKFSFNEQGIYFVDPDFLDMFSYPFVSGDKETALRDPFSVVLTQEMARKYFKEENPLGKTLHIVVWYGEGKRDYRVTGVVKDVPSASHFRFSFLVPYTTLYSLKRGGRASVETWEYYEPKTYVMLESSVDTAHLEVKFPAFLAAHKGESSSTERMHLQPLTEIHLGGNFQYELEPNSDRNQVYFLSLIGIFILLIACLNYMNLSIARSSRRAVEVGLKKTIGANRSQLIWQYVGESIAIAFLAFGGSLLISPLLLPAFGSLMGRNFPVDMLHNGPLLMMMFGVAVITGLVSGSYPAVVVSSFRPAQIIKGTLRIGSKKSSVFRNTLIVIQFVISIFLVVCTLIVIRQLRFIKNKDLGFTKDQIVTLYTVDNDLVKKREDFKAALEQNPGVLGTSASLDLPVTVRRTYTLAWTEKAETHKQSLNFTYADEDFFEVYGIKTLRGRTFSQEYVTDKSQAVILNQTAVREMGITDPVGMRFKIGSWDISVIGVIEDYHFHSLHREIEPLMILHVHNRGMNYFSIKVSPDDIQGSLAHIERTWKQFSDYPFAYGFLDDRVDILYRSEEKLEKEFTYCAIIALSLACLGLVGLSSFIAELKRKEIGVRKVMGADFRNIMSMLFGGYVKCLILAVAIAWPAGYFFVHEWMQHFAYRTPLSFGPFILAALFAFAAAMTTVSFQSYRAAAADPVDALRYE